MRRYFFQDFYDLYKRKNPLYTINTKDLGGEEKALFQKFYDAYKRRNLLEAEANDLINWKRVNAIPIKTREDRMKMQIEMERIKEEARKIKVNNMMKELVESLDRIECKEKEIKNEILELENEYNIKQRELIELRKNMNKRRSEMKQMRTENVDKCPLLLTEHGMIRSYQICNLCGCEFYLHKLPNIN